MSSYVKALLAGGLLIGLGYGLMKAATPDPDELYKVRSEVYLLLFECFINYYYFFNIKEITT